MPGKSTFARQMAIIVLLVGQDRIFRAGEPVPASGLWTKCSAISVRQTTWRPTFMVEMLETSAILNQATPHSLVILDEVGRGTSTHDGLSIAEACMEFLHDTVWCRTLFATHFRELAEAARIMRYAARAK